MGTQDSGKWFIINAKKLYHTESLQRNKIQSQKITELLTRKVFRSLEVIKGIISFVNFSLHKLTFADFVPRKV